MMGEPVKVSIKTTCLCVEREGYVVPLCYWIFGEGAGGPGNEKNQLAKVSLSRG